jgi:hypothetical protein
MSYSYIKKVFPDYQNSIDHQKSLGDSFMKKTVVENYDNLQFFKQPIVDQNIPSYNNVDLPASTKTPVALEAPSSLSAPIAPSHVVVDPVNHSANISHVLSCEACKTILMKNLNFEVELSKNRELMELLSFVLYGLFLILLLNMILKKNRL